MDLAKRLEELKGVKGEIDARLVKQLEERSLLIASEQQDLATETLFREARARYPAGDTEERISVARAVIASLGGIRMTDANTLICGVGRDTRTYTRKKKDRWVFDGAK